MTHPFTRRPVLGLVLAGLAALSIGAAPSAQAPIVLAAASLQESLTAAADAWAKAGHKRPVISFAASSTLARQAEAGAPGDLFVSADEDWMDALAGKGLLAAGTRADLVGNRLVVVEPVGRHSSIPTGGVRLARLLGAGPLAMADPDSVPAGRYGKTALEKLGAWTAVAAKVVRAENVRAALALVERGAAPFGIVYLTDAKASSKVRVAGVFPPTSHPPILYPIAQLARSTNPEAEGFRRFVLSPRGRDLRAFRLFGAGEAALTPEEWGIVALSLRVGLVATLAALPIAFAIAWLLARGRFPGKILIEAVVYLPLVVPPVVTGWFLLLAFAPGGPLGVVSDGVLFRWTGAAIAAGVMALPLMVRAIRLSIEAVDRRLEGAARTLGAGPWRVFWTITLPLSLPGLLAGTVLGFARSLGEFGATITFVSNVPGQTQTLPLAIYAALQRPDGDAIALRLSALSVAVALAALVASELLARRMRAAMVHGV